MLESVPERSRETFFGCETQSEEGVNPIDSELFATAHPSVRWLPRESIGWLPRGDAVFPSGLVVEAVLVRAEEADFRFEALPIVARVQLLWTGNCSNQLKTRRYRPLDNSRVIRFLHFHICSLLAPCSRLVPACWVLRA